METLEAKIRIDHTALVPAGNYDLSGADQVKIGRFYPPPTGVLPFVWLSVSDVSGSPPGVALGRYGRALVIDLAGYVGASSDDVAERILNAGDLMSDVWAAIENDIRTKGGTLYEIADLVDGSAQGAPFNGDENDLAPGLGVFFSTFVIPYQVDRGL